MHLPSTAGAGTFGSPAVRLCSPSIGRFRAVVVLAVLSLAVLLFGLLPRAVRGQGLPLELGVGVARNGSPTSALSEAGCAADTGWTIEGRGGLRFSRAVRLEATTGYNFDTGVSCSDPVGPPAMGPFEQNMRLRPAGGYAFLSSDARLSFEPSSPAGAVWFRVFGGYGRMWEPGVGYWLAGGGLVFGGNVETVLDFEWNWFDLPFTDTVRTFEDGVLISEQTSSGETSHSELRIKAGFRLHF